MKTYDDYILQISEDPTYYGTDCTDEDGRAIAGRICNLAANQFPGLHTEHYSRIGPSAGVRGPDVEVCEEIECWVNDNWMRAI